MSPHRWVYRPGAVARAALWRGIGSLAIEAVKTAAVFVLIYVAIVLALASA